MSSLTANSILTRLAHGELLSHKMAQGGAISAEDRPKILSHINDALKDIFSRFLLSKREVIINTTTTITNYYIRYEYVETNDASTQPVKYIDASICENFDGRIAKILAVYDAFGRELFMNKSHEPLSVFTPEYDCVQITANHQSEQFWVIFQALHPVVTYVPAEGLNPAIDTPINIPPALENPLMLLVASKVFSAMTGQPNLTKAALLMQQFETSLLEIEMRDTASTSENTSNTKLDQAGFR